MSGKIPREFIDELLVRIDIVDLVDSHVPLKKTGSNYMARCPFHTEKSPSFSVNRAKQFYHCFGCGAGGNAISFLMAFSHLEFVEAIEDLASFAGVDVPKEAGDYSAVKIDYNNLYHLLEQVAVFYVEQLRQNSNVIDYLKNRGLTGETARVFSLGYAPDEWHNLANQFDQQLLIDAGMLVRKDNNTIYDRFRGRLMFPIRDKRKRVIGFGGRVLDNSQPKYLNSPETAVFSKSKELYGLPELLNALSKPTRVLIVEGYMDVLVLRQYGINYSVAALGTATSKLHLDTLFRFTSEIVYCFDGDSAGQKAAWRAVQDAFPCLKDGRQIKVMLLPQGEDPDSLIQHIGLESFENLIQNALVLSSYFFETLCKDIDLNVAEGRAKLLLDATPHIEKIPIGFFKEMMVSRLKKLSMQHKLDIFEKQTMLRSSKPIKRTKGQITLSPIRIVLSLLLQNPYLIEQIEQDKTEWLNVELAGLPLLKEVIHVIKKIRPKNTAVLMEYFRGHENEKIINTLINWDFFILEQGIKEEFLGSLKQLFRQMQSIILDHLLMKEQADGLNPEEKLRLRRLLANKI